MHKFSGGWRLLLGSTCCRVRTYWQSWNWLSTEQEFWDQLPQVWADFWESLVRSGQQSWDRLVLISIPGEVSPTPFTPLTTGHGTHVTVANPSEPLPCPISHPEIIPKTNQLSYFILHLYYYYPEIETEEINLTTTIFWDHFLFTLSFMKEIAIVQTVHHINVPYYNLVL